MRNLPSRSRLGAALAASVTTVALAGAMGGLPPSAAAGPAPTSAGQGTTAGHDGVTPAVSGAAPSVFKTYKLRGGYVASGVSLRNRGQGSIKITGIPKGAKVKGAFLLWSALKTTESPALKKGTFAGKKITGTKVGSGAGPCWNGVGADNGFAYRANVTPKVKGNGTYKLFPATIAGHLKIRP